MQKYAKIYKNMQKYARYEDSVIQPLVLLFAFLIAFTVDELGPVFIFIHIHILNRFDKKKKILHNYKNPIGKIYKEKKRNHKNL